MNLCHSGKKNGGNKEKGLEVCLAIVGGLKGQIEGRNGLGRKVMATLYNATGILIFL